MPDELAELIDEIDRQLKSAEACDATIALVHAKCQGHRLRAQMLMDRLREVSQPTVDEPIGLGDSVTALDGLNYIQYQNPWGHAYNYLRDGKCVTVCGIKNGTVFWFLLPDGEKACFPLEHVRKVYPGPEITADEASLENRAAEALAGLERQAMHDFDLRTSKLIRDTMYGGGPA